MVISTLPNSSRPRAFANRRAGSMVQTMASRPAIADCNARLADTVVLPTPPGPTHTSTSSVRRASSSTRSPMVGAPRHQGLQGPGHPLDLLAPELLGVDAWHLVDRCSEVPLQLGEGPPGALRGRVLRPCKFLQPGPLRELLEHPRVKALRHPGIEDPSHERQAHPLAQ